MSIDFVTDEIRRPLPLGELVASARRIEADLLGLAEVPALRPVAGERPDPPGHPRRLLWTGCLCLLLGGPIGLLGLALLRARGRGRGVAPGRPLDEDDLRSTVVGSGAPGPSVEVVDEAGRLVFILPMAARTQPWIRNWNWLASSAHPRPGGQLVFIAASSRPDAVVAALALALAAAIDGGGRFADDCQLRLAVAAGIDDENPAAFIAATRLPPRSGTVAEAAHAYLRQFEHLKGRWPWS